MPKPTPFHPRTSQLCQGQNWEDWSGYMVAPSYELDHNYEYNAIRVSCGLLDVSPLFKYHVYGRDALKVLNRMVTRDLSKCGVGQAVYATWCDDFGKVIDDGSLAEVFRVNLHNLAWRWFDFLPSGRIGRVLGLFLLGYWLAGRGFFSERASDPRRLLLFASLGTVLTLAGMYTTGSLSRWPSSPMQLFDNLLTTAGQLTLALAYACLIAVIFRRPFGRRLLEPLTLVGRLAFTSYLMQTLIGITLFYGVGFGLCGSVPLAWLMPLAVAIYAFQVLFASCWLARYRFGPVEWVWRCLTYGERFPNRR